MSYQVKDYYGNLISEFETKEELESFVSSSQVTSSLDGETELSLAYFAYDAALHDNLNEGITVRPDEFTESDLSLVRIVYNTESDEEV